MDGINVQSLFKILTSRRAAWLLSFALAIALLLHSTQSATGAPAEHAGWKLYKVSGYANTCDPPVRIMPLGNSITRGTGTNPSTGYRQPLYLSLTSMGYDVDFVGSLQDGQTATPSFDTDHEGHGGQTDDYVAANVYDWLTANPADVVLLHIGTNDLDPPPDPSYDPDPNDVAMILDEIDQVDEDIIVILARIINRMTYSPETTQFNNDVAAMAQDRIANGDQIVIVDMENALTYPDDMHDEEHPNSTGYGKMADVWLDALDDFLPICLLEPTITSAPVTEAFVGESYTYDVNASGNPPPTYTLTTIPTGMTISETTGLISWAPTAGQTGANPVEVEAHNSAGTDTQAFTVSVNIPTAPVITSTPVTETVVNQLYTYDVEATGDPPPTYTLANSPSGMSINTTTGLIQWTPTSTGSFPSTVVASNLADAVSQTFTVNVLDPAIAVTKSPATQTVVEGGTAVFTITVSNTGDTPLSSIQVSDPLSPDCDNSIGTLTAGGSTSYTCSQANVTADFTNTITATGTYTLASGPLVTASDTDSATVNTVMPAITIAKSPITQTVGNSGTAVFKITITNTGDVSLSSVQIDDPLSPGCDKTISTFTVGNSTSYTCSQANVTADFTNTITATGTYILATGSPVTVSDTDSALVDALVPAVAITKAPTTQTMAKGGTAVFTITITNTGDVSLNSVQVSDPLSPNCHSTIGSLNPGASTSYTCAQANVTADFTNTITATGTYTPTSGSPILVSDTDSTFVDVLPNIVLNQSADETVVPEPGGLFTFTVTVTNTSSEDVVLTSLVSGVLSDLTDLGNPALTSTTCNTGTNIAADEGVYTCSFTAEVSGEPDDYTIPATATAEDDEGNEASASDDAVVTITESTTLYLPVILNN